MSPEAQRIAIAEACGWREIKFKSHSQPEGFHPTLPRGSERLPDYLNSLDAMHEAEKTLTADQRPIFAWHLMCSKFDWYKEDDSMRELSSQPGWLEESAENAFVTYHAGTDQRAEAFLRTIGKWTES